MSKNAKKYQKALVGKQKSRCSATPKKVRYRDHEEATDALFRFKSKAMHEMSDFGSTSFRQKRVYECSGCIGFHTTSQERGNVRHEVVRGQVLTIADLILSA